MFVVNYQGLVVNVERTVMKILEGCLNLPVIPLVPEQSIAAGIALKAVIEIDILAEDSFKSGA